MASVEDTEGLAQVSELLGGRRTLKSLARRPTADRLTEAIRAGLPAAALEAFVERTELAPEGVTGVLGISSRTWARRRAQAQPLSPVESDRLYRLARTVARATDVLGDRRKAVRWLRKSNRALGGQVPFELLDTEIGEERVSALLDRIDDGVFG